jgi:FlaA1/EpsC-like NDP-sugar epimerase
VPLISNWENQKEISEKVKNIQIEDLLERNPIILDNKTISKDLKDKTILITGAAGSIGSEIVRQVIQFKPHSIVLVDQGETPLHQLTLELETIVTESNIHSDSIQAAFDSFSGSRGNSIASIDLRIRNYSYRIEYPQCYC